MSEITPIIVAIKDATDYQTNKRILNEKMQTELHLPYNGGMFYVDMALIAFLGQWHQKELVLLDTYQNPILVDKYELLQLANERYQAVMNSWHQRHNELKQTRRV
jgi:hypothetical protein